MTGSSLGFRMDYRLGGIGHLAYCRTEDLMRVSEEVLDSVIFLGTESSSGAVTLRGTAFLVSLPAERIPDGKHTYLITARHNIRKAEASGDELVLRVNLKNGEAETFSVDGLSWFYPENEASDLAVSGGNVASLTELIEHRLIPFSMFATEEKIKEHSIGVGDPLIVTGLFARHYGRKRNFPIVRTGNIAAMPDEPLVDLASGLYYNAYLAEIRSIGGLSGSPVFVELGIGRQVEDTLNMTQVTRCLLGVIRGHWNKDDFDAAADFSMDEKDELNSGIAIVTPITDALEIINGEDFVKERKRGEEKHLKEHGPVEDSSVTVIGGPGESEFDRFDSLVGDLVNTPKLKPEDDAE